jgi:hypothetical protein
MRKYVDLKDPEVLAAMQRMYEHAVEEAKQALADAISWQDLWVQLLKPELRPALETHLDEVSFDRLQNLALNTGDLLKEAVNEWAYGKPIPEML